MKLHTEHKSVERSNVNAETAFSIKTTAKAFDILSSGLYTDNILAIVRELSCNAQDSHVAANKKDVPFLVHLPNNIEPWFSVKDEGLGLDHDQVMSLYTTYFESTKTESNDFIGALGLGSKSPFSYASAFEVIAIYNGQRRMYSAFINENGVPAIAMLNEIPTDQPNGVEVKLTVKPEDFTKFRRKTQAALRWFENKPRVVGNSEFYFENLPSSVLEGTNWKLMLREYGEDTITAVQGSVGYSINPNNVSEHLPKEVMNVLRRTRLVLSYDIGDLEVAASREEIRYDPRSVAAIVKSIEVFCKEITAIIESKVADIDTTWDKFIELSNISHKIFSSSNTLCGLVVDSKDPDICSFVNNNGVLPLNYGNEGGEIFNVVRLTQKSRYSLTFSRATHVKYISPDNKVAIFVNDMKTGGVSRIKHLLNEDSNLNSAIIITPVKDPFKVSYTKDKKRKETPISKAAIKRETKSLLESFGGKTILYVSKDTVKNTNKSTYVKNSPFYQANGTRELSTGGSYYNRPVRVSWQRKDHVDMDAGGLWFSLRGNSSNIYRDGERIRWAAEEVSKNLKTIVDIINKKFGSTWTTDDVYGVTAAGQKKLIKHDKWFNVFELFDQCVMDYKDDIQNRATLRTFARNYDTSPWCAAISNNAEFVARLTELDSNSVFRTSMESLATLINKCKATRPEAAFVEDYDQKIGQVFGLSGIKPTNNVFKLNILDKYEMLQLITGDVSRYNVREFDTFFGYIKTIDNI